MARLYDLGHTCSQSSHPTSEASLCQPYIQALKSRAGVGLRSLSESCLWGVNAVSPFASSLA